MIKKKTVITISCVAAVAAAALAGVAIFGGGKEDKSESSTAADVLAPVVTEAPTEAALPDIEDFTEEAKLTGRAKMLLKENEDVNGYIKISNTYVDYPVVQYDGENLEDNGNDYYLHKDLYGNYLDSGTIFMDYRDVFEADESKQSENIVLYGHNMLNGTKFATLHYYMQDETFYEKNPLIEFSSNYKDYNYVIFGYFYTSGDYGESAYGEEFAYWDQEELDTEKDFNKYVETVHKRSVISPDIDVKYGDKLLTLSTCHLDIDNSRLIVVARRLREDETPESIRKAVTKKAAADDESAGEDNE